MSEETKPDFTTPVVMSIFTENLAYIYGYGSEVIGEGEAPEFQEMVISPVVKTDVFNSPAAAMICFDKNIISGDLFGEINENSLGFYTKENGEISPVVEIVWLGDFSTCVALYTGAMVILKKADDNDEFIGFPTLKTDEHFFGCMEIFGVSERIDFAQLCSDVGAQMLPNPKLSLH